MPSRFYIVYLLLCALLLLSRPSAAGPSGHSQNRQTITVVSDDNYPPCIFRDAQGNLRGMLICPRILQHDDNLTTHEIAKVGFGLCSGCAAKASEDPARLGKDS
jgi:hypothetical protein